MVLCHQVVIFGVLNRPCYLGQHSAQPRTKVSEPVVVVGLDAVGRREGKGVFSGKQLGRYVLSQVELGQRVEGEALSTSCCACGWGPLGIREVNRTHIAPTSPAVSNEREIPLN